MIVFDRNGLIWASPESVVKAADLREVEAVARVRSGQAFYDKLLIHGGRAMQIAGVPVKHAVTQEPVGGILIGIDVSRYMTDFKQQGDKKGIVKYRMVFMHDRQVVASAFVPELWTELGTQLAEENWGHKQVGDDKVPVVRLKNGAQLKDASKLAPGDYEFLLRELDGFAGLQTG